MDGVAFLAYVEQILVPTLNTSDIGIMDNLPAHKVAGVREMIEGPGQSYATCRPTVPTSIQSKWRSRNSKLF